MNRKRETRWERKRRLAAEAARPAEVHGTRAEVIAEFASMRAAVIDAVRARHAAEDRADAAESELAAVKATLVATTEALDAEIAKHAEREAELAAAVAVPVLLTGAGGGGSAGVTVDAGAAGGAGGAVVAEVHLGADEQTDETKDTQGGGG